MQVGGQREDSFRFDDRVNVVVASCVAWFKRFPAARLTLSIATFVALSIQVAVPAFADGGAGGSPLAAGGAGGTGFTGNPGGNGGSSSGGGGGGAGGGNGGDGTGNVFGPGAKGGTSVSPDGENGPNGGLAANGQGGGGGFGAFNGNGGGASTINATAALTGGKGGKGGNGGSGSPTSLTSAGAGGGGGAGGFGAIVTGAGMNSNSSSITGGNGGNGGNAGFVSSTLPPDRPISTGGNGGDGGIGVLFTAAGASLLNSGSIVGGSAGNGGDGARRFSNDMAIVGVSGTDGISGVGVSGTGLTLVNGGTIAGGTGRAGQAKAIDYTGGANKLTLLNATSGLSGGIGVTGTLELAQPTNATLDSTISGSGSVSKTGAGVLTLANTNIYTGATTIGAGTLNVNGSIASSSLTTVNAGGTLGGSGTVGNTNVASGGTFAPGNGTPGSSMTVAGNLAFQSGALYLLQIDPAAASSTNVTGTATPGGAAVRAVFAPGGYINRQYTILTATGGVAGTFDPLVVSNATNFRSTLSYDATHVFLNIALNFNPPTAMNANQQAVANAIIGFFNSNGGIPAVFGSLTSAGLTQLSGEAATGSQQSTFDAMGLFMGLLTDPFIAGRGDPVTSSAAAPQFADEADGANAYASNGNAHSRSERDAYAAIYRKAPIMADPFTQRWSVWAAGYGGSQTIDGNTVLGSNNTRSSIGGVAVGADYRFSPNTLAGFAIAGGGTNFSVNGLGSGRSDLFQAGAFVRHTVGPAYISAALAYGWQDITTDRTVTIAGTDLLHANLNANAYSGRVEGGYRLVTPWLGGIGITPYAAGQFTTFDLPAYAEQVLAGAGTFALSYMAKSVTDTRSELGIRSDKSFAMQNGIFTLRGRAAWAHDFDPDRNIGATFQTLPGASFVVNGATHAADSALVTGSAEMKWLNGFSLAGTFEGEFSNVTRSYAGKGVVRYAW
jgi:uncharacterized protein with beta-barrel porin domain